VDAPEPVKADAPRPADWFTHVTHRSDSGIDQVSLIHLIETGETLT